MKSLLYEIKMENPKKKIFFVKLFDSNWDFFCIDLGKNILFGIGNSMGLNFGPKIG